MLSHDVFVIYDGTGDKKCVVWLSEHAQTRRSVHSFAHAHVSRLRFKVLSAVSLPLIFHVLEEVPLEPKQDLEPKHIVACVCITFLSL